MAYSKALIEPTAHDAADHSTIAASETAASNFAEMRCESDRHGADASGGLERRRAAYSAVHLTSWGHREFSSITECYSTFA